MLRIWPRWELSCWKLAQRERATISSGSGSIASDMHRLWFDWFKIILNEQILNHILITFFPWALLLLVLPPLLHLILLPVPHLLVLPLPPFMILPLSPFQVSHLPLFTILTARTKTIQLWRLRARLWLRLGVQSGAKIEAEVKIETGAHIRLACSGKWRGLALTTEAETWRTTETEEWTASFGFVDDEDIAEVHWTGWGVAEIHWTGWDQFWRAPALTQSPDLHSILHLGWVQDNLWGQIIAGSRRSLFHCSQDSHRWSSSWSRGRWSDVGPAIQAINRELCSR